MSLSVGTSTGRFKTGPRARLVAVGLTAVALVSVLLGLSRLIDSGPELTQLRNAFIATPGEPSDFEWRPGEAPPGFLVESAPVPELFDDAVDKVLNHSPSGGSNLDRALVLARHLSSGPGVGNGIKSTTIASYQTILTEKRGYCSDYTQVMNGLAYASDIPIREWGMSFDDYSGSGHAFSEVFDEKLDKWVFVDSFFSLYAVDPSTGEPLSVLELRQRLSDEAGAGAIEMRPIDPDRFGFKSPERAVQYYRKGAEQFFLYFGNNVFSYDRHKAVAAVSGISRAVEESVGILFDVRPKIRLLPTSGNGPNMVALFAKRRQFLTYATAATLLVAALLLQWIGIRRGRRRLA